MKRHMTTQEKLQLILDTHGLFFTVEFVKKDQSLRKMNCRIDVSRHTKGGSNPNPLIGVEHAQVFDLQIGQYRTINCNTLKSFTFQGKRIEFV